MKVTRLSDYNQDSNVFIIFSTGTANCDALLSNHHEPQLMCTL